MRSNQRQTISAAQPLWSVPSFRTSTLLVWALVGMGLFVWSMPGEAQTAAQDAGRAGQQQESLRSSAGPTPSRPMQPVPPNHPTVTVDDGKLSVSLQEVGLREVMEAIALRAGVKCSVIGTIGDVTLTTSFTGVPLEEGLRRLLQGTDYAMVYTGTGAARRVSQVFIMSGSPAGAASASTVEAVDEPAVAVAKAIREATDTRRFADTMKAAIGAEGGLAHIDIPQEEMAPEFTRVFQRVLAGQEDAQALENPLRLAANRLRQILEQQGH